MQGITNGLRNGGGIKRPASRCCFKLRERLMRSRRMRCLKLRQVSSGGRELTPGAPACRKT